MNILACSSHLLLDLPIFMGPVAVIVGWVVYIARRERKRESWPRRVQTTK